MIVTEWDGSRWVAIEDMDKLILAISKLKGLLGPGGEYAISKANRELMNIADDVLVGSILEDISSAITALKEEPK